MKYRLTGEFIESCNCLVVCPCWVQDKPTEDHCAGFFAWTFDPGSTIDGYDVAGLHVVVVTVHTDSRRGGGSESVVFADNRPTDPAVIAALLDTFTIAPEADDDPAGRTDPVAELRSILGFPVAGFPAAITIERADGDERIVRVNLGQGDSGLVVDAAMTPATFDGNPEPLTLTATALDEEMGSTGGVQAQRASRLNLNVTALSANTQVSGRSGMVGRFSYESRTEALVGIARDTADGDDDDD